MKTSTACKIVQQNLKVAQERMKVWYDRKAHKRSFNSGNKILVLLPIPGHPLQARYSGPYVVEDKVNDVNYIVQTPERRKRRRMPCEYAESLLREEFTSGLSQIEYSKASGCICQCSSISQSSKC